MSHITVGKWGKNLAVRFPGDVAREIGLREGEQLEIEAQDGTIVIRRAPPHFTLEDLFRGRRQGLARRVCRRVWLGR